MTPEDFKRKQHTHDLIEKAIRVIEDMEMIILRNKLQRQVLGSLGLSGTIVAFIVGIIISFFVFDFTLDQKLCYGFVIGILIYILYGNVQDTRTQQRVIDTEFTINNTINNKTDQK